MFVANYSMLQRLLARRGDLVGMLIGNGDSVCTIDQCAVIFVLLYYE